MSSGSDQGCVYWIRSGIYTVDQVKNEHSGQKGKVDQIWDEYSGTSQG